MDSGIFYNLPIECRCDVCDAIGLCRGSLQDWLQIDVKEPISEDISFAV